MIKWECSPMENLQIQHETPDILIIDREEFACSA